MAAKVYVGRVKEKGREFIAKAKAQGYEQDAITIGGAIALCQQNPNDPYDTFQAMIDLIDVCKDDDEFIKEAGELIHIDELFGNDEIVEEDEE